MRMRHEDGVHTHNTHTHIYTGSLSTLESTNSYSFSDLGLSSKHARGAGVGGMGQRVGEMASVLASGMDPAVMAAAGGAGNAAAGGWTARFQTGDLLGNERGGG